MAFQRENQRIAASEILQQLADAQDIKLDACTITGTLDLNRLFVKDENFDTQNLTLHSTDNTKTITLPQAITFRSCTFEGDVLFAPPWDRPDDIQVIFKRDAIFNSSIFHGQVRVSKAVFHGLAGFDGCAFRKVACFRSATFTAKAMYRTVTFNGYGLFNKAIFEKEARFTNTCFAKGANFTEVNFSGITDFTGVYAGSKSVPVYESVTFARRRYGDDETFWRFIKQAAQEAGYYQLAGESFYNERCGHFWKKFRGPAYHELSKIRKFTRILLAIRLLPEFIFGRLLFGYGERPVRVIAASALIILACAFFYASPHASLIFRDNSSTASQPLMEFMDGMYFSIITFTTLGFGDMYPDRADLLTRCVAMFEALSGACLMALFVVCLAKRFSRG